MALIGPGSEWFWTAISGVILAITFIAIYRQLRLQRDAAAIEQVFDMERTWSAERMSRSKLLVLLAIEAGTEAGDLPPQAASHLGDYWERVGYLTRTGHIDRRLAHEQWSWISQEWWGRLQPTALAWRERRGEPAVWEEFEWLARTMAHMDGERVDRPDPGSPEYLAQHLGEVIAQVRQAVEIEEALRTVTVRLTPTPIPVTVHSREARTVRIRARRILNRLWASDIRGR
jgi:hypothetical protein